MTANRSHAVEPVRTERANAHPTALSVTDLTVSFGGLVAIEHVSLDVPIQQIVAVIGPNGAGKTTLLNAVCGLLGSDAAGTVHVAGVDVSGQSAAAVALSSIGRSYQHPPLLEKESALTNVMTGGHLREQYRMIDQLLRIRHTSRRERLLEQRAMECLEFVGLASVADERVGGLSFGTRKLIDIARALVRNPELLLLDEPTSGLDKQEQETVIGIIGQLSADSKTALVVEHHMDVVRRVCGRAVGLVAGRLLVSGTPDEVFESPEYRAAIIGSNRP